MAKPFQFLLLAFGVIALLAVGGEIIYSIAATTHGSTPARVVQVQAGPYPLTVSLYTYPAHASYALPFSIAPPQSISGALTSEVPSLPDPSQFSKQDASNTTGGAPHAGRLLFFIKKHKIGVFLLKSCAILIRAGETAAIITNALDAGTARSALPVRKDTSDAYCTDTGYAVSQFVFSAHPDLFLSLCRKAPYLGNSNPVDWLIWPYHHDTLFLSIRS